MQEGIVYTETVVHAPPERFAEDAPYQIAIVDLKLGGRVTARIAGERVSIGDAVVESEARDGIPYFRKSA